MLLLILIFTHDNNYTFDNNAIHELCIEVYNEFIRECMCETGASKMLLNLQELISNSVIFYVAKPSNAFPSFTHNKFVHQATTNNNAGLFIDIFALS